jgi:hypothetical protein
LEGNIVSESYETLPIYVEVPEDIEVNITFVVGDAPVPTVFEVTSDS